MLSVYGFRRLAYRRRAATLALAFSTLGCAPERKATSSAEHTGAVSNLVREDYAGSGRCAGCHGEIYERWNESPMRRMTRQASAGVVSAPFDGARFRFKSDVATMTTDELGGRYMQIESREFGNQTYRVTKVIGGRYREDYAGVRVAGVNAKLKSSGDERILPASYLLFSNEWRYKGYSVMTKERPGLKRGLSWRKSCIFCHNTAPALSTLFDDVYGLGAPTYQGAASVELPFERRIKWEVGDEDALLGVLEHEIETLSGAPAEGGDLKELLEEVSQVTLEHFEEGHLVEVGIGCEACHGGARRHAENPSRFKPQFLPQAPFLTALRSDGQPLSHAQTINHTCAKCHTVLFSRYPFTWEGGERGFSPGGSNMNSGEARNFLLGSCSSELSCVACHDPHSRDQAAALTRFDTAAGNRVCTSCHTKFSKDDALARHSHHLPTGEGAVCVNCHMPKKNVGLDYSMSRYHRIGSPTDKDRVEKDRPLECSLCHSEKSVGELLGQMERWYQKRYDRNLVQALYGGLDKNVLLATLENGKAHERVVAVYWLGRHRRREALGPIVSVLSDEYPLLRFFAQDAIEQITGSKLELDMHAPGVELVSRAQQLLQAEP